MLVLETAKKFYYSQASLLSHLINGLSARFPPRFMRDWGNVSSFLRFLCALHKLINKTWKSSNVCRGEFYKQLCYVFFRIFRLIKDFSTSHLPYFRQVVMHQQQNVFCLMKTICEARQTLWRLSRISAELLPFFESCREFHRHLHNNFLNSGMKNT